MIRRLSRGLVAPAAFRWTLAIAGAFTLMALLLFGFIYWQTAVQEQMLIDTVVIREAAAIGAIPPSEAPARLDAWLADDPHGVRYGGLFAPGGAQVAGNLQHRPKGLTQDGLAHRAVFKGIDRDHDGDEAEAVRAVGLRLSDGNSLVLGYDIDELEDVEKLVLRALGLGLVPMVLLSTAGGTLIAWRAQRRIGALHEAIGCIIRGQLGVRLPVQGAGDNLDRVAIAVNGMVEEIERLVHEIRGVGDSIAHDLRTPLTRVRMRLERARDEAATREEFQLAIDRIIGSVDQALTVISAMLRIGEIEHGRRQAAFRPVDLAAVLQAAAELYEPLAEESGIRLVLKIMPVPLLTGDSDLLLEAMGNLLDNAIKYGPSGTDVTMALESHDRMIVVRVTDCGAGIPLAERGRVLQRFYRSERSRTVQGSGLGLSLVEAIARLHGFQIEIGDANPGCDVRLICPLP
jgi:signal transduction histidine kinase